MVGKLTDGAWDWKVDGKAEGLVDSRLGGLVAGQFVGLIEELTGVRVDWAGLVGRLVEWSPGRRVDGHVGGLGKWIHAGYLVGLAKWVVAER